MLSRIEFLFKDHLNIDILLGFNNGKTVERKIKYVESLTYPGVPHIKHHIPDVIASGTPYIVLVRSHFSFVVLPVN